MKLKVLMLAVAALATGVSSGATGVFGSYAEIFTSSSTVYVAQSYAGSNPSFNGADFGSFTVSDTLNLTNASLLTFKSDGGDVTGAEIQWRVFKDGDTPGSFNVLGLNFGSNAPSTDLGGNSFSGGNDQEWRGIGAGTQNLLAAATSGNGDYNVEIFFRAFTNEGDRFSNNGGANYVASFTLIPEPTAALLGSLGAFALLRRRR